MRLVAVRQVKGFIEAGHRVAVDVDLSKFFDRVNHDKLMGLLANDIGDKVLPHLLQPAMSKNIDLAASDGDLHEEPPMLRPPAPHGRPMLRS